MGLCPETPILEVLNRVQATYSAEEIQAMWYDWFCKDTSLERKGHALLTKLRSITPSPRFDATKTYTFFKNNCPCDGSLYDDFRICQIGSGDVVYCVVPAEGYKATKGEASVWGKAPDTGEFEELVRGAWKDVKKFFQVPDAEVLPIVNATRLLNVIRQAEWENKEFDREQYWKVREAKWSAKSADQEYTEQFESFLAR